MISKLAKINNDWKWITLSDEEEEEIRKKHRIECNEIFKECLHDAKIMLGTESDLPAIDIASALFERRSDAIFSVLQRELDNFTVKLRKNGSQN